MKYKLYVSEIAIKKKYSTEARNYLKGKGIELRTIDDREYKLLKSFPTKKEALK